MPVFIARKTKEAADREDFEKMQLYAKAFQAIAQYEQDGVNITWLEALDMARQTIWLKEQTVSEKIGAVGGDNEG